MDAGTDEAVGQMITSGRRAKRPDGTVYRTMRRQGVAGRTLLEGAKGGEPRGRGGLLRRAAGPLTFFLKLIGR
jgi:hypothetical protein